MFKPVFDYFGIVAVEPDKLVLMVLIPVLFFLVFVFWLFKIIHRPQQTHGSRYPILGTFKFWASVIVLLVLAIMSLTRPVISGGNFVVRRGNVEVIFLVDYSSSMFLKDTGLARIDIAVREIMNQLAYQIITDGDKVALFVFGNETLRRVPLTTDLNLFANEVDMIGRPNSLLGDNIYWGSDIAGAFAWALLSVDRQDMISEFGREVENWKPKPKENRMIFVFTDGGDIFISDENDSDKANIIRLSSSIGELNLRNLKVYPIGIGSRNGALLTDLLGDYKKNEQYDPNLETELKGKISRLNVKSLEYLKSATRSDGPFLIENERESATHFMRTVVNKYRSVIMEPVINKDDEELWQYFLIAALATFVLGMFITKF